MVVGKRHATFALLSVVVLLAVWRVQLVHVGPDADTDAYGHHAIARQLLVDPTDFGVHWVWLPLFQYLQAIAIAFGASIDTIRLANVLLVAALPLVLFRVLLAPSPACGRGRGEGTSNVDIWVAFFAALLCAFSSIVMQMGTTAQPEPLFALVVLLFIAAYRAGRFGLASLWLGAAVLLRYEAWAILLMLGAMLAWDRHPERSEGSPGSPAKKMLPVATAGGCILVWAVLRRPVDGSWFAFVHQTREFANDALHTTSSLDRGPLALLRDLVHYPAEVPWHTMGPAVLFVPFGIASTWRKEGAVFVLLYAACLAFVTLTWVMKSSLGLDRHFVVLVPFYATLAANGAASLAHTLSRRSKGFAVAWGLFAWGPACVALIVECGVLQSWMHEWRGALLHGFPDRAAISAFLRSLSPNSVIFCDEATVEILSHVDRHRFDRHWVDDPRAITRIAEASREGVPVYVASWRSKIDSVRDMGQIVYPPSVQDDSGAFEVLRVEPPAMGATKSSQR